MLISVPVESLESEKKAKYYKIPDLKEKLARECKPNRIQFSL